MCVFIRVWLYEHVVQTQSRHVKPCLSPSTYLAFDGHRQQGFGQICEGPHPHTRWQAQTHTQTQGHGYTHTGTHIYDISNTRLSTAPNQNTNKISIKKYFSQIEVSKYRAEEIKYFYFMIFSDEFCLHTCIHPSMVAQISFTNHLLHFFCWDLDVFLHSQET